MRPAKNDTMNHNQRNPMKYRMLALALTLTGCDLLDSLEETIDPPPKVTIHENIIRECARDSVQLADTLRFEDCEEVRPPAP